jgi:thiol-disulfide isomerase/thioredoxin
VKNRWLLPALFLALACWATAQTTPPTPADAPKPAPDAEKPKPAARETPPDTKAFNDANKLTDPKEKIAALEKWKVDFPTSSMRSAADNAILSTLIKKYPEQQDRIRKQAKSMVSRADAKQKAQVWNTIASQLLDADLLLKDAESYSSKSVHAMKEAEYIQDQKAGYLKRKQKVPSDDELRKRFAESRANRLATLGRIDVKLGQTERGRKLLEESYAANASQPLVAAALGEMAAKAGNDGKAFDYLVTARLSGKAPATAVAALDGLYRKSHDGSLDGFSAMLDAEYNKRFPNPLHLETYKPSEKRSDRVVLAEVFTGSGCPPCVGADLAFDAASERYSRKDLAVLMYHQHIPRPDPMTTLETTARFKFYDGRGVPTYIIDGKNMEWGGGDRDNTNEVYKHFDPEVERELDTAAEAHVSVGASLAGSKVKVMTMVKGVKSESKDLKVQVVLAEKQLTYSGENGVRFHPMVVRAMGGPKAEGFDLHEEDATFEQAFGLDSISSAIKDHLDDYEAKGHRGESFKFTEKKYEIAHSNLVVVVFVQDSKTKHVLQAGFIDLSVPSEHRITESEGGIGEAK